MLFHFFISTILEVFTVKGFFLAFNFADNGLFLIGFSCTLQGILFPCFVRGYCQNSFLLCRTVFLKIRMRRTM
jgi:hypothetical protein